MDWQKVISALKVDATKQAFEADRYRNAMNQTGRRFAISCGTTSMVLAGLAAALEEGHPARAQEDRP